MLDLFCIYGFLPFHAMGGVHLHALKRGASFGRVGFWRPGALCSAFFLRIPKGRAQLYEGGVSDGAAEPEVDCSLSAAAESHGHFDLLPLVVIAVSWGAGSSRLFVFLPKKSCQAWWCSGWTG